MDTRSKIHEAVTIVGYLDPIDEKKKEAGILITTDDEDFIVLFYIGGQTCLRSQF